MSSITSYKTTAFKESQKFLVIDPSTQSPSLVLGSDLVSYITPMLNYVRAQSTRLAAENTDYDVGTLVQTSGATSPGDNFAATYLVVEGGTGDFPMLNGNDLLVIKGDEFLREQLAQNTAGDGSDLIAHTGTSDTVTEALDKRTIYVGSVAELKALSLDENSFVETKSYYSGAATGYGRYLIKTLAQHRSDISDGAWNPDEKFDHTLSNGNVAILQHDNGINLLQGGLKTLAEDALSDVEPLFVLAQDKITSERGAGTIFIGNRGEVYGYKETMQVTNNMVVEFFGEIKCTGSTTFDCAIMGVPGADGYRLINPLIDCDNQPAEGGVYFRRNNTNARATVITVKNAAHDKTTKGGRAVVFEAGVNPTENRNRNGLAEKIIAKNCFSAVLLAGGDSTSQSPNMLVETVIAENCEHIIQLFANDGSAYPPSGSGMSGIINTVIARNCGKQTTYAAQTGAIVSDRGGNVVINNFVLANDGAYGSIGSLVYGDFYNVHVKNAVFMGDCTRVINFSRFAEQDTITDDLFYTGKSAFDIKHVGSCTVQTASSLSADSKVIDTEVRIVSDTVTGGNVLPSQMTAKTSVFMDLREVANNSRIIGMANRIGGTVTFSDYPNSELEMGRKLRLPTYVDNASATSAGLNVGDTYAVTGTDPRQVAVVF